MIYATFKLPLSARHAFVFFATLNLPLHHFLAGGERHTGLAFVNENPHEGSVGEAAFLARDVAQVTRPVSAAVKTRRQFSVRDDDLQHFG